MRPISSAVGAPIYNLEKMVNKRIRKIPSDLIFKL